MDPLLPKLAAKNPWAAFVGGAIVITAVAFFVVGLVTNQILAALLLGPALGVAGAYALFGWPKLARKDGKPLVDPNVKPWLFFPLAFGIAAALYAILGVFLTPFVPPTLVSYVAIFVAALVGVIGAFLAVGFPHLGHFFTDAWAKVPPENRPWLFFPLAGLFALLIFFLVGIGIAATSLSVDLQPFISLPVAILLAIPLAYFLVGFPKPKRKVSEMVPTVPGRARPLAFLITALVAFAPLAYVAGLLLGLAPALAGNVAFPLALLAGAFLALGLAALVWGTPRRWRRFPDYKPGMPLAVRRALALPIAVLVGGVGVLVANVVGFDLFLGAFAGLVIGIALALLVSGVFGRAERGNTQSSEPPAAARAELPDKVKPLAIFATWALVTAVLFLLALYVLPTLFFYDLVGAVAVGLAVALVLLEAPLMRVLGEERRERRALKRELAERRKRALAAGSSAVPEEKQA
ncbi:MAG: hypothetical protein ACYDCK_04020 [Thermoplasmatota archaeon]